MEKKKIIKVISAVAETVPLSPGVLFGRLLFVSGQVSKDLNTGSPIGSTERDRTGPAKRQVILKEPVAPPSVSLRPQFLRDIKDFPKMNEVYKKHFPVRPCRSTVVLAWLELQSRN
jgi:enamine deaminase RidA (YjgF/YER057c/UK114 family)